MSTGKQLTLWAGMTEAQQNQIFHKSKAGKNRRIKIKQKCISLNQTLIVKMRKDLRPTVEIAKHLQLDANTVRNFLVKAFGDNDPLDLHVLDSFNGGESAKAIGRRLSIKADVICKILKKHGIDPWKAYLERESESFRLYGVPKLRGRPVKNPDRPRFIAEDLYCFWLEMKNIDQVAIETGYGASSISARFNSLIPGYKDQSVLRRQESRHNRKEQQNRALSEDFKTEKSFQDACAKILSGLRVETNVRGKSSIEIDLLVSNRNGKRVLIECKIRSRKPDLCKAIGQSLINRSTYEGVAIPMICLPDDLRIYDSFFDEAKGLGVYVCHLRQLRQEVDNILF